MNTYVGESEKAIREIFRKAWLTSQFIIFFDEIDAIPPTRSQESEGNNVSDRMQCQLLNEIDRINANVGMMVIASTNRPDIIDKALLRPERIYMCHSEIIIPEWIFWELLQIKCF